MKQTGRFYAKCIKDIGCYQEGETYDILLNGLFSTRAYTPEERDEYEKDFNKKPPSNAQKFIEGDRMCVFKFYADANEDAGYTVFETSEAVGDYFNLQPK